MSEGSRPGASRPPGAKLSLRGQALAHLSRREYSRQELRTKLIEGQRRRRVSDSGPRSRHRDEPESAEGPEVGADGDAPSGVGASTEPPSEPPTEAEIDQVLDWLEAKGYLSDERFIESRLHARSERHGSIRIRQELSRHGLALTPEQAGQLRETELARAREVWRRKFGEVGADPRERARQARFLSARGFPAEIVRRIVGGEDD